MDMGMLLEICSAVWVEATKVRYSGKATMLTPSSKIRCDSKSRPGRRSIMSVLHFLFDEAELNDGERHHNEHQNHGLSG